MKFIASPFTIEDIEKLKRAGADAIILSLTDFSLRGCAYFDMEQLPQIKALCASLEVELFIQMNRFFYEHELSLVEECLAILKQLDVDGIYFGDEGVLWVAQKLGMVDKMIYAPDTLLTNSMDCNYYLAQGLHSVVLAKEITLDEIFLIAKHCTPKRLEVMIHGRLNMMHSKRHLLSNYVSFIKKDYEVRNKKSLYIVEEQRDGHMPILEDDSGTHVFSAFTLACFEEIQRFADANIGYVRIESLFQDTAYVELMLELYHQVLRNEIAAKKASELCLQAYPDVYEKGFLYTKTSKLKQEGA